MCLRHHLAHRHREEKAEGGRRITGGRFIGFGFSDLQSMSQTLLPVSSPLTEVGVEAGVVEGWEESGEEKGWRKEGD